MAKVERRERPVYSAICPCCACTIVELRGVWTTGREAGLWSPDGADSPRMARPFGPLVWTCTFCGFALMGLAVPTFPRVYAGRWMTCLEVLEATDVDRAASARLRLGIGAAALGFAALADQGGKNG